MGEILTAIKLFCGGLSSTTWIILALSALLSVGAIWFHHNENQLQLKSSEITALQISDANQKAALAQAAKDAETIQDISTQLITIERNNAGQAAELTAALAKLDALAVEKPSMVEAIINKASDERNRCLALVTGALPVKKEVNSICPQVLLEGK